MKKFVILAGLVAVALLLGVAGTAVRSDTAQAKPEDVITFSPKVCISLTSTVLEGDWNDDGDYTAADQALAVAACGSTGALASIMRPPPGGPLSGSSTRRLIPTVCSVRGASMVKEPAGNCR